MRRFFILLQCLCILSITRAQQALTPEMLWQLGRVSVDGISKDNKHIVFHVGVPNVDSNKVIDKLYLIPVTGGAATEISNTATYLNNDRISPNGKYRLLAKDVKMRKVFGKDFYPALKKSTAQIYDGLAYRHWDEWEDGAFSHVFVQDIASPKNQTDIMAGQPYDCPQKPFGGNEDFLWSPEGNVIYVTKAKVGTAYALSTNTDVFSYNLATGTITNLSENMEGYDIAPAFSKQGTLAWLSMKREGYEADKQDIIVKTAGGTMNLTENWDGSVEAFLWSGNGSKIYFTAAIDGTVQLFSVNYSPAGGTQEIKQITNGDFDVNSLVAEAGNKLIVTRTDMNHAAEIYSVELATGAMQQLSHVNDKKYENIAMAETRRRYVTTTDGKQMLVWMIYPPGFDSTKAYPTLLYCQGGPQSPLTQSYSYRWNFQLMASAGYIVVAPNRRGMYGHGREWNEQISKDWGGQVMNDYLSAIDDAAKLPYVDKNRLGCVGASYGGYSVFYLAGIHNNRFKTFIAHDGVFDIRSMSGTTEELWFTNWEIGGNYWEKENKAAQKTFAQFNPADKVGNWNTPIMIIQGGKDYRVPIEQGLQAFTAAQLKGIKSKLLYLPDENHWVLKVQNALVWQHEFYKWLKETL